MSADLQESGGLGMPESSKAKFEVMSLAFSPDQVEHEIKRVRRRRRLIAAAVIVVLLVAVGVLGALALKVPGAMHTVSDDSMVPALSKDQVVLVQPVESPADNDVVAYRSSLGAILFKRIVAAPGEWVNVASDGTFIVSATSISPDEMLELTDGQATLVDTQQMPAYVYFAMADADTGEQGALANAENLIVSDQIVGKVTFGVWPLTSFGPVR